MLDFGLYCVGKWKQGQWPLWEDYPAPRGFVSIGVRYDGATWLYHVFDDELPEFFEWVTLHFEDYDIVGL
jgi:hypothetical protein